jgi:hypothetical protein
MDTGLKNVKRANEPAFPGENAMRFGQTNDCNPGMTIREHFAGLAMQGLLAGDAALPCTAAATLATDYADALIAELEKAK